MLRSFILSTPLLLTPLDYDYMTNNPNEKCFPVPFHVSLIICFIGSILFLMLFHVYQTNCFVKSPLQLYFSVVRDFVFNLLLPFSVYVLHARITRCI